MNQGTTIIGCDHYGCFNAATHRVERSRDAEHNTGCNDYCKTLKHREHWIVMVCEGHVESVDEINYTVDGVFDIRKEQA